MCVCKVNSLWVTKSPPNFHLKSPLQTCSNVLTFRFPSTTIEASHWGGRHHDWMARLRLQLNLNLNILVTYGPRVSLLHVHHPQVHQSTPPRGLRRALSRMNRAALGREPPAPPNQSPPWWRGCWHRSSCFWTFARLGQDGKVWNTLEAWLVTGEANIHVLDDSYFTLYILYLYHIYLCHICMIYRTYFRHYIICIYYYIWIMNAQYFFYEGD